MYMHIEKPPVQTDMSFRKVQVLQVLILISYLAHLQTYLVTVPQNPLFVDITERTLQL